MKSRSRPPIVRAAAGFIKKAELNMLEVIMLLDQIMSMLALEQARLTSYKKSSCSFLAQSMKRIMLCAVGSEHFFSFLF